MRKNLMTHKEVKDLTGSLILHIEIHDDVVPTPYNKPEYNENTKAIEFMRQGEFTRARALLEPLAKRYPNHANTTYNLAQTYLHDTSLKEGKAQAERLLLEIFEQHPSYLFPKAELAEFAMKRGDLKAATDFLQVPEGLKRVHASEYAAFSSAMGRLAIRQGNTDFAQQCLEVIATIQREDSPAYRMLEAAFEGEIKPQLFSNLFESGQNFFKS
jgi:predicted Zn-dependent protease